MSAYPLVSIIIPSYNYGHLISETLNCLLKQTYQNWEAIIIDDGSTDNTKEIVNNFIIKDSRFRYIIQRNQGVSSARNHGIKEANGKYVQFLDADDLLSDKKIANHVLFLEESPEVDIALSKTKYFESDSSILYSSLDKKNTSSSPEITGKGISIITAFIHSNQSVVQSPLFKKSITQQIGFFNENMHYLEDWDFWFRCAINGSFFYFLNDEDCYSMVRIHSSSASKVSTKIYEAEGGFRSMINSYIKDSDLTIEQKKALIYINRRELINTYKVLMAKTSVTSINKWRNYYKQISNLPLFYSCLIKALNIKRKKYELLKK